MLSLTLRRAALIAKPAPARLALAALSRPTASLQSLTLTRLISTTRVVRQDRDEHDGYAATEERQQRQPKSSTSSDTLYIGNMPFTTDEEELRTKFSLFGGMYNFLFGLS